MVKVIFLDPAGKQASHGAMLEEQAVGRVMRVGQTSPTITTVRLVTTGTIEGSLFEEIAASSAASSEKAKSSEAYICEGYNKTVAPVAQLCLGEGQVCSSADDEDDILECVAVSTIDRVSAGCF